MTIRGINFEPLETGMESAPSWLDVSRLIDAYASPSEIPRRVKEWRKGLGWSHETLSTALSALADEVGQQDYRLPKLALIRIEKGDRNVSVTEAVGLSRVFKKSLSELLLPDGALEEAEDWRELERAINALRDVRRASRTYAAAIASLRIRIEALPKLRAFVEEERARESVLDEAAHRANYDRHQSADWFLHAPGEPDPSRPSYAEWRKTNHLLPSPTEIAIEHVLGKDTIIDQHWFLGWDEPSIRIQLKQRDRRADTRS